MLNPEYGNIIIVGTIYKNIFNWYITEKELWLMDLSYLLDEDGDADIYHEDYERYNIPILDENTVEQFFENIKDYRVETQKLKKMFKNNLEIDLENALYDFPPALYINFDKKQLYSSFPETQAFHLYTPKHWLGVYVKLSKLLEFINTKNKYWIIEDKNYFEDYN